MCKSCDFYDTSMKLVHSWSRELQQTPWLEQGVVTQHAIRKMLGNRATADLSCDNNGRHFAK